MSKPQAPPEVEVEPVPLPRLRLDPDNPRQANIDDRTVARSSRPCRECGRQIAVVCEVQTRTAHDLDTGPMPKARPPGNFPGPSDRCPRCVFAELFQQDRWVFGLPTHQTIRGLIEATADAVRPSELALRADLERQLEALGPDDSFKFPLGPLRVGSTTQRHGVYGDALKPLLDRHVSGDFGTHGTLPSTVSAESAWWPELATPAERNALAIRDRLGFVRSGYELSHHSPLEGRDITSKIKMLTFIDGDKAETLLVADGRSSASL